MNRIKRIRAHQRRGTRGVKSHNRRVKTRRAKLILDPIVIDLVATGAKGYAVRKTAEHLLKKKKKKKRKSIKKKRAKLYLDQVMIRQMKDRNKSSKSDMVSLLGKRIDEDKIARSAAREKRRLGLSAPGEYRARPRFDPYAKSLHYKKAGNLEQEMRVMKNNYDANRGLLTNPPSDLPPDALNRIRDENVRYERMFLEKFKKPIHRA